MEDLSDIDDPVGDAEYKLPQEEQEPSSSEEVSSGCENPIPQPFQPIRGCKRLRDEYEGYRSDRDIARSRTPRRCSQTQQDEADVSSNVPNNNKPVLMMSAVCDRQPEDTCQRWDKKLKQYVPISRSSMNTPQRWVELTL